MYMWLIYITLYGYCMVILLYNGIFLHYIISNLFHSHMVLQDYLTCSIVALCQWFSAVLLTGPLLNLKTSKSRRGEKEQAMLWPKTANLCLEETKHTQLGFFLKGLEIEVTRDQGHIFVEHLSMWIAFQSYFAGVNPFPRYPRTDSVVQQAT